MNKPRMVFVSADVTKGLGDWIMTLPAVALTRRTWPHAEIVAICPPHILDLVDFTGLFDDVLPYGPNWLEEHQEALYGATFVMALCDANAYQADKIKRQLEEYRVRVIACRNEFQGRQHHGEMVVKNLCRIGIDLPERLPYPIAEWRPGRSKLVAIHAGHGHLWPAGLKNWPYFPDLISRLEYAGYGTIQIIGPDDKPIYPGPFLRGSLVDVARCLLDCAAFVGNDSGISHLAGALGVPCLTLFGFTDAWLWKPLGPRVRTLEAPDKDLHKLSVEEVYHCLIQVTNGPLISSIA